MLNFSLRPLLLVLLLAVPVFAQDAHVPTARVEGNSIIVDGDFAVFTDGFVPDEPPVLGTIIAGGNNIVTETRPPEGIRWDNIPPGTYQLTIHGRPDDYMFPQRQSVEVTLVVQPPLRPEQIRTALMEFLLAKYKLAALNPTVQEILDALAGN